MAAKALSIFGFLLSSYAVYVEYRHENEEPDEEPFKALCDIEALQASCSSVFALPEGKLLSYFNIVTEDHLLDVPNAMLGMIYYSIVAINEFSLYSFHPILFKMIVAGAMSSSIYLAIVLTQLKELCILCWTTHAINSFMTYNFFIRKSKSKSKKE